MLTLEAETVVAKKSTLGDSVHNCPFVEGSVRSITSRSRMVPCFTE